MLDKTALRSVMLGVIQSGSFPANGPELSAAIAGYVQASGSPVGPTISYTLAPCTGAGWTELSTYATSTGKGVGDKIVSIAMVTEFSASTKAVPAEHGTHILPMSFNAGASAGNLSNESDYLKVWDRVAEAIIKYFEPEIK